MGLGGLLVPGTLRDSLFILDAIHRLDAIEHPEVITTDQGSYCDIVYGLFAICGYQFAPRHADITDTQLWWADTAMLDGELTRNARAANGWGDFNDPGPAEGVARRPSWSTGTTWCGWPGRWPPARSAPTT